MKKILSLILISLYLTGCFSNKNKTLAVSAVYPFEGRYDSSAEIVIDGNKATVKKDDSIWILSNHTVYYLLTTVSDSQDKIVLGKKAYDLKRSELKELRTPAQLDSFDDEEYIWEKWTIPTNGVR